jgi:hypothetical protein
LREARGRRRKSDGNDDLSGDKLVVLMKIDGEMMWNVREESFVTIKVQFDVYYKMTFDDFR